MRHGQGVVHTGLRHVLCRRATLAHNDLRLIPHHRLAGTIAAPELFERCNAIATATGTRIKFGRLKKLPRLIFKPFSAKHGRLSDVNDHIRLTFEAQTVQQIDDVRTEIKRDPAITVLRDKMRLDPAEDRASTGGYADCQMIVRLTDGGPHSMEIQAALVGCLRIKTAEADGAGGHAVFAKGRKLLVYSAETHAYHAEWSVDLARQIATGMVLDVTVIRACEFRQGIRAWTSMGIDFAQLLSSVTADTCRLSALDVRDTGLSFSEQVALMECAAPPGGERAIIVDRTVAAVHWTRAARNDASLSACDLSRSQLIQLPPNLCSNTFITSLDVSRTPLNKGCVIALCEVLRTSTSLASIDLAGTGLGGAAIVPICTALAGNTTITTLSLAGNPLSNSSCTKAVAKMLRKNQAITDLDLGLSGVVDADRLGVLHALAEANRTVIALNLAGCELCAAGAAAVATLLERNPVIAALNLADTALDWNSEWNSNNAAPARSIYRETVYPKRSLQGVSALADAIKASTTIVSLVLNSFIAPNGGGHHANQAYCCIVEALKCNKSIVTLGLCLETSRGRLATLAYHFQTKLPNFQIEELLNANHTIASIDLNGHGLNYKAVGEAFALRMHTDCTPITVNFLAGARRMN